MADVIDNLDVERKRGKWIATGGWRGYFRPKSALVGQSVFGEKYDRQRQEEDFEKMKKFFKKLGIPFRATMTESSNVFMVKRWIVPTKKVSNINKKKILEFAEKNTKTFHDGD